MIFAYISGSTNVLALWAVSIDQYAEPGDKLILVLSRGIYIPHLTYRTLVYFISNGKYLVLSFNRLSETGPGYVQRYF